MGEGDCVVGGGAALDLEGGGDELGRGTLRGISEDEESWVGVLAGIGGQNSGLGIVVSWEVGVWGVEAGGCGEDIQD